MGVRFWPTPNSQLPTLSPLSYCFHHFRCIVTIGLLLLLFGLAGEAKQSSGSRAVLVEIFEDHVGGDGSEWPYAPSMTASYREEAFGLFELPHKYVSTGVRGDWASPTFVRVSGSVQLPAGKHRVLLRARGASRLFIDGMEVLRTPYWQPSTFGDGNGGELPLDRLPEYLNLGPEFRFLPPGNREDWSEIKFSGGSVQVSLETLIGGIEPKSKKPFRPELGETVVAFSLEGETDWWLLSPSGRRVPYTDSGWRTYEQERRERLDRINAEARAAKRAEDADYWSMRRDAARHWLETSEDVSIPSLPAGFPAHNEIDWFLAERIHRAAEAHQPAEEQEVNYFTEVRPILETHCYSCHQGGKVKGGLRLDSLAGALKGGRVDGPAIFPGDPEESPLIQRITSEYEDEVMPALGDRLSASEVDTLRKWVSVGAPWPEFQTDRFEPTPLTADLAFLRRVTLDTVGVFPSEDEIAAFQSDSSPDRRTRVIDRLLADPRWADHWMGYWQDVLAENPNLINPTLNNTGPFRWWIYESLLDNKPLDLFVTELLLLEGSERFGGPAGFGIASGNDVPMAAKGIIVSSAFMGVEMKCARCHDAPTHSSTQEQLFSLAAMLETTPLKVPETSSVAMEHLMVGGRTPLIEVTLHPGSEVAPAWPFADFCDEATARRLARNPDYSRDMLAALITAPQNERFAQVMANRLWQRFMGRGLVPSVGDWERSDPTHPELLRWLGRELVRSGYDAKALARLILNSHAYQRAVDPELAEPGPLFVAPAPRRLSAEQLVDSVFAATGKPFDVEPVNLDVDSVRTIDNALDLGRARRAWMLGSTSNERDRPSLMLPRMQAVGEVMEVFGWRGARPDASDGLRDTTANVLQPALLANGTMVSWLTRLSDDHGMTQIVLEDLSLDQLLDRLFVRLLTRLPTPQERKTYRTYLAPGFEDRRRSPVEVETSLRQREPSPFVAWSNHMLSEANLLRLEEEAAARRGDPPTRRLDDQWRERFEDVLWALLNAPELTRVL